jgi:hypothetical protein
MDNSTFVVMLARQRSGTNPLRAILDAHPEVFCSPEIFHPEPSPDAHLEVEMNYFEFLERHASGGIKGVMTSLEAQELLFLDYLRYLRCFSDKRYILLDVKYNSTHVVDGPWRDITQQPQLFFFIREHGLRVLNLTRRNYLRYYLSWMKANLTDQWTHESESTNGSTPDDVSVTVPTDDLMPRLELCRSENQMIAHSFGEYPLYTEVEYEDLFPTLDGPPSAEQLQRIADWLGVAPAFPTEGLRFRKQAVRPLKKTIRNYAEVVDLLGGTPLEYCLDDEPMYRNGRRKKGHGRRKKAAGRA